MAKWLGLLWLFMGCMGFTVRSAHADEKGKTSPHSAQQNLRYMIEEVRPDTIHDPVVALEMTPPFLDSRFAYTFTTTVPKWGAGSKVIATQSRTIQPAGRRYWHVLADMFDPQFSPTGNYLLFKASSQGGQYEKNSHYGLYQLDLRTGQLMFGPREEMTYRGKIEWSHNEQLYAFIKGGDEDGRISDREPAPVLMVFNVRRGRSRPITVCQTPTAFAWTKRHELVFTPSSFIPSPAPGDMGQQGAIYIVNAAAGSPKVLIKNATGPLAVSPNGEWLGYMGLKKESSAELTSAGNQWGHWRSALCLYNFKTKETKTFWDIDGVQALCWSHAGTEIVAETSGTLQVLTVGNGESRIVPVQKLPGARELDLTSLMGLSRDDQYAVFKYTTFTPSTSGNAFLTRHSYVQAVHLKNGSLRPLYYSQHDSGVDWWDNESAPKK